MSNFDLVPKDKLKAIAKDLFDFNKNVYSENPNPFSSTLNKLDEYENLKLSEFLEKVILAKSKDELNKIIDKALEFGIRINAQSDKGFSFTNVVIFKIFNDKLKQSEQEAIIKKLAINGADLNEQRDRKTIVEICNKVQKEVKPQIYGKIKKLREVAENSTIEGMVIDIEFDNKTFFIEFSKNSKVDIAKIAEGAKNLGLSLELNGNTIKIGDAEVKVRFNQNGERNYVDVSDNSSFTVTFQTSLGELHVLVQHDMQDYHQIQVKVDNIELWNKLQKTGEIIGQGCFFGETSVKDAIEKGGFVRSSSVNKSTEVIKPVTQNETWVNKIKSDKTSSIGR